MDICAHVVTCVHSFTRRVVLVSCRLGKQFERGGVMEGQEFEADAASRMDAMGLLEEILVRRAKPPTS